MQVSSEMRGVGRTRPAEEAKRKVQEKGVREKYMKAKEDLHAKNTRMLRSEEEEKQLEEHEINKQDELRNEEEE